MDSCLKQVFKMYPRMASLFLNFGGRRWCSSTIRAIAASGEEMEKGHDEKKKGEVSKDQGKGRLG